ncbi:alpha/beta fold hydrolase [Candidatus Gottesmanbacteria bacterium]|nr:alpha/beta fold hydrolase [Candidatus Gottesmanbacteria bacterium]
MILIEDGNILGSWDNGFNFTPDIVRLKYANGNTEFANFQLCDSGGCDAPSPTPTSTPTPMPTPTPTPTPIPVTKVVVIPGFGASWNKDAIMNCKTEGYEGDWTLNDQAADVYNPLLTALTDAGWTTIPYYYDWRKQVTTHAAPLAGVIDAAIQQEGENVHLVGHSMGGLLGRAYLEAQADANKLDKLLTVGSPHKGNVLAYPAWSGGEIWEDNLRNKMLMTIALRLCDTIRPNNRETIRRVIPSVQNLLPVFDYLKDFRTGAVKPVIEMDAQNNWLPTTRFTPPFYGVTVGTLSGTGFETLHELVVKPPSRLDTRRGDWTDGKPLLRRTTTDGDGTVLLTSSEVDGATYLRVPQPHNGLVSSGQGINEILNFLGMGATSVSTASFVEPTSALVIMGYPADLWLTDPAGSMRKDNESLITIFNPRAGSYKLRFLPKGENARLIIAQFLENGKVLWKEYPRSSKLPEISTFRFDPAYLKEDLLR